VVRNKAVYLALGVRPDGTREILGLWIKNTEVARFCLELFNDLKTRGVNDTLIAVTDSLKGIDEVLAAIYRACSRDRQAARTPCNGVGWRNRNRAPHDRRRSAR